MNPIRNSMMRSNMVQNLGHTRCSGKISNRVRSIWFVVIVSVVSICVAGCGNKFFDPTQVGRFRPVPSVNVILDSLGIAEETPPVWKGAEEPRPIDVMVVETDYVFNPGDIVRVNIFELLQEGQPFLNDYIVTETGKISIPEVGVIEAGGLTESQLEDEIRQILSPSVLKEPSVVVTLLGSEKRTFSIWGDGVARPSRYEIPRYDFRLTDALATAWGIRQFNVSNIYVSRSVTGKEAIAEPVKPEVTKPEEEVIEPEREMLEIIAPRAQRLKLGLQQGLVVASTEMITDRELAEAALPEGFEPLDESKWSQINTDITQQSPSKISDKETVDEVVNEDEAARIEWIFQDGRWVPIQVGQPKPEVGVEPKKVPEPLRERVPEEFDWDEIGAAGVQTRVIRIPADKLLGGDPRYNIVIRPGDSIHVPVDIVGEFCIMGNVNAQGFIDLTGRPMTLKMAIAAAGGLGPLAWPKRCEVIRRIGKDKEEIVMVDLDKIAAGEQPDFFIKPNDLVNVGTHPTARWRAVLRNAFRATYGFGFVYDRNFADRDYGTRRPFPHWF